MTRSTSNRNARGSSTARRRRREWLVETFRADVDAVYAIVDGEWAPCPLGKGEPACRCYRCGTLLTVDTVTVDRIDLGVNGGTYKRDNIRPACGRDNSSTGGKVGAARAKAAREAAA